MSASFYEKKFYYLEHQGSETKPVTEWLAMLEACHSAVVSWQIFPVGESCVLAVVEVWDSDKVIT